MIKRPLLFFVILFILGLFLGERVSFFSRKDVSLPPTPILIKGIISTEPTFKYGLVSFILKTKKNGKIQVSIKTKKNIFCYGDLIQFNGLLQRHAPATNPLLSSYGNYLQQKKIFYATYITANKVKIIKRNQGNIFFSIAISVKNFLLPVHKKTLPNPYDCLMGSIIFGNTASPLPKNLQDIYKRAGVVHLLVVSGSQIALLVGVSLRICQSLGFSGGITFLVVSFLNILFTLMTGADPSITRACIMTEVTLIGKLLRRDTEIYTTMAIAALISLLINPLTLFNVGFLLSFAATWALVYIAPILEEKLATKLPKWIAAPLAICLAPTLTTTPLTIYYFSAFSIVSLPMNLIVNSWVEILVVLGFLATILGIIWLPLAIIINGTNFLLMFALNKLAYFFAGIPLSYLFVKAPHWSLIWIYYLGLILFVEYLRNGEFFLFLKQYLCQKYKFVTKKATQNKKLTILITIFVISIVFFFSLIFAQNKTLTITMLDVGQGDALLIETADNKKILIDAGIKKSSKYVVVPVLQRKGINSLDLLIATHCHADHIGGFPYLIENIKVKKILDTYPANKANMSVKESAYGNWYFREYRRLIKREKIIHHIAKAGMIINLGKHIKAYVLNPSLPYLANTKSDDNENSVVILLVYNNFSILFTGDLGDIGEKRVLNYSKRVDIPIQSTVLKVGHHGSMYSSSKSFLDIVQPNIALISCGQNNRYKHPHKQTIDELKKRNIRIYRTDQDGAVIIKTDGKKVFIDTVKSADKYIFYCN